MAMIVNMDGSKTPLGDGTTPLTLEQMQQAVGGYIEVVHIHYRPYRYMIVNEEGLIMALPVNPVASAIAEGIIVGTALLLEKHELE